MTSSELYNTLMLHFWEEEDPVFPEVFAGAYPSGDYLIILLTNLDGSNLNYFINIVSSDENLIFRHASYSYNHLLALGEELIEGLSSLLWWGVNVPENVLEIMLDTNNPDALHEASSINASLPVIVSFSEEVERIAPDLEGYFEDVYYELPAEESLAYNFEDNNSSSLNWTLIIVSITFLVLAAYSFFVVRRRST